MSALGGLRKLKLTPVEESALVPPQPHDEPESNLPRVPPTPTATPPPQTQPDRLSSAHKVTTAPAAPQKSTPRCRMQCPPPKSTLPRAAPSSAPAAAARPAPS